MRRNLLLFISFSFAVLLSTAQQLKAQLPAKATLQQYTIENKLAGKEIAFYMDTLTHRKICYRTSDYSILDKADFLQETSGNRIATTGNDAGFHLIKDINTRSNSSPYNSTTFNYSDSPSVLNNVCYFFADDGIHGFELWESDGTAAGTFRVSDVIKDSAVASTGMILAAGKSFLYFTAYNYNGDYCIFKFDPATNAIQTLFELKSNMVTPIESLNFFNDTLYFVVSDGSYANQLWKSDGTKQGTVLVKDINANGQGYEILNLVQSGNLLYFSANKSPYGWKLWRSDGTGAGTYMINDTIPSSGNIFYVTPINNKVYYVQKSSTTSRLWVTDGTSKGTLEVKNLENANIEVYWPYFSPRKLTVVDGILFFNATTTATGTDLWKYNTTGKKGLELVKNINLNHSSSSLSNPLITRVKDVVYFMYEDTANIYHLYKTRGNALSTQLVKDFNFLDVYFFYGSNDKIYFIASTADAGVEPWISDGTDIGTFMVKDINPGYASGCTSYLGYCKNNFLFAGNDAIKGSELWRITANNKAQLVKDINIITNTGSSPDNFAAFENGVLFSASNYDNAKELWRSDSKTAVVIKDPLGQSVYDPSNIQIHNKIAYVSSNLRSIYSVKENDTVATKSLNVSHIIQYYTVRDSGTIIYARPGSPYGSLMKKNASDTAVLLKANFTVTSQSNIANDKPSPVFLTIGNITYFQGYDENGGKQNELWKTDGTPAGTTLLKTINVFGGASYAYLFTNYNNELFFRADDNSGNALWRSDGTTQGTVKVSNIIPSDMIVYNTSLFISGYTTNWGYELWTYNGSTTTMLKDINPGGNSSNPSKFFVCGNILYFMANDGIHGTELWRTDGTDAGTKMIKDLTPGSGSSNITNFTAAANNIFFNKDGVLWMSNGTEENTIPVPDAALAEVKATNVTGNDNEIYFSGSNPQYGAEPWAGDVSKYNLNCIDSAAFKPKIYNTEPLCFGSYAILYTNYVPNKSYLWSNGDTEQIIGEDTPGIYTVRIKYKDGCYSTSDPYQLNYGCLPPIIFENTNVNPTKVTVNWGGVTCALQYKIQIAQQGSTVRTTYKVDSSQHSFTLNGLKQNTTYKWRIASVCQGDTKFESPWSSYQTFKTPASVMVSDNNFSGTQLTTVGKVSLYPNPVTDIVTVTTPYTSPEIVLTDITGRQLCKIKAGKGSTRIPVSHLSAGIYLVIIKTNDLKHTLQFVKTE